MFSVTQCDYTRFCAYDAGFCMACRSIKTQRLVYLITYSRADTVKFPTRESFGEAVLEAWKFCGIDILQWVVCIEAHANADCHSHDQMNKYHFLLLKVLDGDMVHLPAPKTFCKRDVELTADTPFFATADAPFVLIRKGTIDRTNTEMMNVHWRYFHFWKKIPQAEQKHFAPCGWCFARFILSYVNNETQ